MKPLLHPFLVNDRFGDPALYVRSLFERRSFLFDMGDLGPLSPRRLLGISEAFVSHTHIDHFIGFDRLLRTLVGRDRTVRLFGPTGFIDRVEHRLASYTWNLADLFECDLVFEVTEVHAADAGRRARLRLTHRFVREDEEPIALADGLLHDEGGFRVRCAILDHRTPCLGFAVTEERHINVWKNRLEERGLAVGPWLRRLKQAVRENRSEDTPIEVAWRADDPDRPRTLPLGRLKQEILTLSPGQKIGYVTDVAGTVENVRRIVDLVRDADILFIEAPFARADIDLAAARMHLTTEQAGRIARLAAARRVEPFHFSPRYAGEEDRLREEVEAAFRG